MRSSSFTFTRRYYNIARTLPDASRLAFYDMLLAFVLDGVEPQGEGMAQSLLAYTMPRTKRDRTQSRDLTTSDWQI
ncbi:hypothetical protein FACS1894184_11590 [Clostridia bacterium]|nr:hypothetical protein FACS1894184_11590 [Clostridia bacterium]